MLGWHSSAFIIEKSLHINTVMFHMGIPPCLVISDTYRPAFIVQCELVHSISPDHNRGLWWAYNSYERIQGYIHKGHQQRQNENIYVSFGEREKRKRLPILWRGQVYSWFCDITDSFQPDTIGCKSNGGHRKVQFPSYQTSILDSLGEGKISVEDFKKI